MLKWVLRIGLGFVALITLVVGVTLVMFYSWRADIIEMREADPDRRIIATVLGDIEYACVGEGLPLLSLHGTPGGYDQALVARRVVPDARDNFMMITVSRPGYRGTPLSSGASFQQQADLFAALLDELSVERVYVLAASGGGYVGLQFALRHPNRTAGLILSSPEVRSEAPVGLEMKETSATRLFATEFAMWLIGETMGSILMPDFDPQNRDQLAMWNYVKRASIPFGARDAGRLNDLAQRMDPAIDNWPLEEISVPTLVLHGNADENSSYEASQDAAARIPNAEFVTFEGGSHFVPITRRREFDKHIERFMQVVERGTLDAERLSDPMARGRGTAPCDL